VLDLGVLGGAGGVLFLLLVGPTGAVAASSARIARRLALIGCCAGLLAIGIQGGLLIGGPLHTIASVATWRTGLLSSFGRTAVAVALGLAIAVAGLSSRGAASARPVAAAGAAIALLGFALSGHVVTAGPRWLMAPALIAHTSAVAFWVGSLLPLRQAVGHSRKEAAPIVQRFSRLAVGAVALLILAGVIIAIAQVRSLAGLFTTTYGGLLLAKLAFVAGLLALATLNKLRLTPSLARDAPHAANALRRTISAELAFAAAIVTVTAVLGTTPPPRVVLGVQPPPADVHAAHEHHARTLSVELASAGRRATATFSSGESGPNSLVIDITDQHGEPLKAQEVTFTASNPSAGVEPIRRKAEPVKEGRWQVTGLVLVPAGQWSLRIDALVGDFEKPIFDGVVELR
jgi:copper transport protein